jgi:uncharacterized protein YecE (DUF72 family)
VNAPPPRFVGSAGWNIPRLQRHRFPAAGSQLQRYAARLNATEINSSFYRSHAAATYERWAAAVPEWFRFAVKIPRLVTHDRALTRAADPLRRFLDEIAGLGGKLGPLLLQLPPSFAFEPHRVGRFLDLLRRLHLGAVVCEPRHQSWTTDTATRTLRSFRIARVAADPPRAAGLDRPGGSDDVVYFRWHGSPRTYFSPYAAEAIDRLGAAIDASAVETWCIFDNTGSGSAAANALDLRARLSSAPRNGAALLPHAGDDDVDQRRRRQRAQRRARRVAQLVGDDDVDEMPG